MLTQPFTSNAADNAVRRRPTASILLRRLGPVLCLLICLLLLAACKGPGPSEPAAGSEPVAADTPTPQPEPEPTDTPVPEPEPAPTATAVPQEESEAESVESPVVGRTFVIAPEESEARFIIDEELFGQPKTVVGTTSALSGELTVVAANPSASQIGVIQIDADTFITDHDRRNGAIRRFILQSNRHRYITFNATALTGLPAEVAVGEEVQFEISGDLTVREITKPVLFDVTLQVLSETEIQGTASTVVALETFELTIPQVPSVANVGEEFIVEFDFVARAQ
ncbi:MAG: YceI family protein [Caldilineaceae bacterium]|nr:YceI family protein [Caldilineaceae bacterium]